jgi:hypothetical protein
MPTSHHLLLAAALLGTVAGGAFGQPSPSSTQSLAPAAGDGGGEKVDAKEWTPLRSRMPLNTPVIEARVGDAAGWFVLDTGSAATFFDESWAKEHHLEFVDAPSNDGGLVVRIRVPKAQLDVGATSLQVTDTACIDLDGHSKSLGIRLAGLLGGALLKHHAVRIRYGEGGVDLAATKRPAIPPESVLVPVLDSVYGAMVMILLKQDSQPPVGASAVLDSGFVGALHISDRLASRAKLRVSDEGATDVLDAAGVLHVRPAPPLSVVVGSATFERAETMVGIRGTRVDAIIGSDVLSKYVVVVDYPNGVVVLSPPETRRPFGFDLSVPAEGGDVKIHNVFRGSNAERDGLRFADILLAVNGKVLTKGEMSEAIDAIREAGKMGGDLVLRVRRGDQTLEIKTAFENGPWTAPGR